MVVKVDADAVNVLGMLKQEPGTVEGLLTGSTDVAGWLIFICGSRMIENRCKYLTQITIFPQQPNKPFNFKCVRV